MRLDVGAAGGGEEAPDLIADRRPDVVVSDLRMPEMGGIELMRRIHERDPLLPVVVQTAMDSMPSAVTALRAGAEDYLLKPVEVDALVDCLDRVIERRDLRTAAQGIEVHPLYASREGLGTLVGTSPAMQRVYRIARRVSASRATVLIGGESGTGKGDPARAIHRRSPRGAMPLVTLHCAALAESLLESELFGHEKGAFTGADKRRIGRFEQADGGTLFLDEVGEISKSTQAKLLRVLQERTLERVGGNEAIKVDVGLIAATSRDLAVDVREGRFREDLFYRLNVVRIEMPPLRTRGTDVLSLAALFLRRFSIENGKKVQGFTGAARLKLLGYGWPGNVRELENAMERAVVLADTQLVDDADVPGGVRETDVIRIPGWTLADIERYAILATLDAADGSTAKTAEVLHISIRTVQYRLQAYGIDPRTTKRPT